MQRSRVGTWSCLRASGKHVNDIRVIARQPTITTIVKLLGAVFSFGSAPKLLARTPGRLEAGSNTRISTVDLQVVGGDKKGTQCLGV
jgi:hypothetical protein